MRGAYLSFGQRIICVQRKSAIALPSAWRVTTASHTCVVLPRCAGRATQAMRAVARGAEEVGLELDGGEVLGALGQVRDAAVAAGGVGQRDHRRRVQEAVGREEFAAGCRARRRAAPAPAPSRGSRRAPAGGRRRAGSSPRRSCRGAATSSSSLRRSTVAGAVAAARRLTGRRGGRSQPLLEPRLDRQQRVRQRRRSRCRRPAPCRAARRPCRRPAARRG